MFITARQGTRAVNIDHITDIELLPDLTPTDQEGSKCHPHLIVAHTTDGSTVELAREEDILVAKELMRIYIGSLNRSDIGEN